MRFDDFLHDVDGNRGSVRYVAGRHKGLTSRISFIWAIHCQLNQLFSNERGCVSGSAFLLAGSSQSSCPGVALRKSTTRVLVGSAWPSMLA
jgi:hypothetical protein